MNESFSQPHSLDRDVDEKWLEEQFEKMEILDINGHPLRVLDISPQEAKTEVPVVLAPSYGSASPFGKKVNISELVKEKRRVLFIDEPRGIALDAEKENPAEIEDFFLRQTEALLAVLDKKESKKLMSLAIQKGASMLWSRQVCIPNGFVTSSYLTQVEWSRMTAL